MARKAGSIVVDRLRERILLGRYFGCWSPGDRLPSVRDVAGLEDVDRKTAAAAYRRLEQERLVRVEPRSGVYLNGDGPSESPTDPLQRLHRQWLEHTLGSAAELGLDSGTVTRMLQAVTAVEGRRIPVVDEDPDHAGVLARELRSRTGLDCASCRARDLPAESGPLRNAPFAVATPAMALRLQSRPHRLPVIPATISAELLADVDRRATRGNVIILVPTRGLARELEQAVEHGLAGRPDRVRVLRLADPSDLAGVEQDGAEVLVWPGTPAWAMDRLNGGAARIRSSLISQDTIDAIRRQVACTALEHVSRSIGAGARADTVAPTR